MTLAMYHLSKLVFNYRLLQEKYGALQPVIREMSSMSVQNVFWSFCTSGEKPGDVCSSRLVCHSAHASTSCLTRDIVHVFLDSHMDWETGARTCAALSWITYLSWCLQVRCLCQHIQSKNCIWGSLMIECCQGFFYYMDRHQRPSRREQLKESVTFTCYLKQWEKFIVRHDILYRVSRVMNKMLSVCGSWVLVLWSVGGSPWPCWSSGAIPESESSEAMLFLAQPWQGCLRACEPMPALHCK